MKKYLACVLPTLIIIGLIFLITENVFSQAGQTEDGVSATGMTADRAKALVGGLAGLISLVTGWRAKARSNVDTGRKRAGAITALVLGLSGIILSVVHLSTSAGAVFGSGSGKAGAIVALVLALVGIALGGLALRSLKTV